MIGLLIITHETVGQAYRMLAEHFFTKVPDYLHVLGIHGNESPEDVLSRAIAITKEFDTDNILILTDIYGATPCNIARKLFNTCNIAILTGLNAPMMIKALQYAPQRDDIDTFAEEVRQSAINGIIRISEEDCREA